MHSTRVGTEMEAQLADESLRDARVCDEIESKVELSVSVNVATMWQSYNIFQVTFQHKYIIT